ncbi:fibronectin type III domain-containing protein [Demequina sp. SO4-13]|uniref:fibronectin type III domain-containing protein n=1 Tax=Demequina sp. SO4-13 TaxID=3401027 RepID=UPI003AF68D51
MLSRAARTSAVIAVATALVALVAVPGVAVDQDQSPTRVVLTPPEDPSTSQSFTWRVPAEVTDGAVHLREVGTEEWTVEDASSVVPLDEAYLNHSATVGGLAPATEYEYWVGTEAAPSPTYNFTTADAAGEPFTFIYFGDAQNNVAEEWSPVVAQAYERFPDAVGTVNAGDLINVSGNDSEWDEWFGAMDGHSQTTNVIAAPGNHEYSGDSFLRNWKATFEYAENGPQVIGDYGDSAGEAQRRAYEEQMVTALEETAYYTDYQGVRFISLNASRSQAAALFTPEDLPACTVDCPNPAELWLDMQSQWLDQILENNPNEWAVAVFHQPVFSTAEGRNEVDVRRAWLPVFQNHNIDLVLMGHDHTYARGHMVDDQTDVDGVTSGPVYAVSVSGPKYYEMQPEDANVWTANGATQVVRAGHTSTFQGITVDGDTLTYESVVARKGAESTTSLEIGDTLDAFSITKYDDGTKCVMEDGVAAPGPGVCTFSYEDETEGPGAQRPDAPLGHVVAGDIEAGLTAAGPIAFDEDHGTVFVADDAADGPRIVEVDVETGAELRSFAVPYMPVDMQFGANERAVLVGFAEGVVAAYSVDPWSMGEPLIDPTPIQEGITGVAYDPWRAFAYVAVDAGAYGVILTLDLDSGDLLGQTVTDGGVGPMALNPSSGRLYVSYDGDPAVRVFSTLEDMAPAGEYSLRAGAAAVALDAPAGLLYVAHPGAGEDDGGLSVVDLGTGTVAVLDDAGFGRSLAGVAVDTSSERVYAASASGVPAPIAVAERWKAPLVTAHPADASVGEGDAVTMDAAADGVPEPTVQWQRRDGETWTDVPGANATTLAFDAAPADDGAVFRAVFTSEMGDEDMTVTSDAASVDVTVAGVRVEFTDVTTASSEFYTEIMWLSQQGITKGWETENGTEFRPFRAITRDAMAAFLYRYAGSPEVTLPDESPFVDITPDTTEFYKEIVWLSQQDITEGWETDEGIEFRPFEPITRDAMAAFLYRLAEEPAWEDPESSPFVDIARDETEFYTEITWLESTGITTGWKAKGGVEFRPFASTTRDAMAAFVYRYEEAVPVID